MKVDHSKKVIEFTEKLRKIPEIIGIAWHGSTATESWDEYSDIDIDIVVKDEDYDKIVKMIPKLMKLWGGEVKFLNTYETWDETYAFIGDDYFKVEIEPIKESYFKTPHFDVQPMKIVYDKKGVIKKGKKISQRLKRNHYDPKYFRWNLLETRSNFIYVVRHYMRGQKLHGVSELNQIGGNLFQLLGRLKELEGWENIRTAEQHLTKKEWNFLKISRCNALEKKEIKRSILANWEYMRYIEKLYEKKTGKKLNLGTNDKEILDIVLNTLEKR